MGKVAGILAAIVGVMTLSIATAQVTTAPLVPKPAVTEPQLRPAPVTPAKPASAGVPQMTAEDVNAWLDGFVPYGIGRGDIPGAVVVVVKDGQILTSRGYGYADVSKRKKVDPASTLFRPGSISKLFTWTAVMQQVEQGKLDLDADVNTYLDFKIPPYHGRPITLRDIMTHTPGFEEAIKDIITTKEANYIKFDTLLKRWIPERVYMPGTTPAYSNYATSLAAYIVQRVSGQPFDQYIERNIFTPLGMAHSTFRQPLPANLKPLMAEGYVSGKDEPYGYEFVGPAPAGSLAATGEDMGRFMIAHLQNGELGGKRILQPQTAQLMHSRVNQLIPGLNGMAHGFYQANLNGLQVIAHGGDTVAFHSDLHLIPEKNVGLYVSFNSAGKDGTAHPLRGALFEEFVDRYFPATDNRPALNAKEAKANAEKLAGLYLTSRGAHSNFFAITDLISQAKVSVDKDGNPVVPVAEGISGQPRKWVAIGPMLWRDANGTELLGATVKDGKAVRFSFGEIAPIIVWDRVPWYKSSGWLLPLLYLSLAVLALTALLWPVRARVRRKFGSTLPFEGRQLLAYRASRISAVAILAVIIGWAIMISILSADVSNFTGGYDAVLILLQLLSIVVFFGGFAAMAWYAYTAWKSGWRWTGKAWSVLLVISAATILYIGLVFKLIGLTTNY
jgi:CubicO group peptidase (beta-lactamase class C family)